MKNEDVTPIINLVPYISADGFEPIKSKVAQLLKHCYSLEGDDAQRQSVKLEYRKLFQAEADRLENKLIPIHP